MTVTVCKHGNRIDVEFMPAEVDGGFYKQTVKMPICKKCIVEAVMGAMVNQTQPFHASASETVPAPKEG